jgi:biotin carboxyl carrier protein
MAEQRIVVRDEHGEDHHVVITGPDEVAIDGKRVSARRTGAGEFRAGEHTIWAASQGDKRWTFVNGHAFAFELQPPGGPVRRRSAHDDNLSAPMPATVVKLHVSAGDEVKAGQLLLVLEAMKMELPVRAASDARVAAVRCREGELVQPGQPLIELSAAAAPTGSTAT